MDNSAQSGSLYSRSTDDERTLQLTKHALDQSGEHRIGEQYQHWDLLADSALTFTFLNILSNWRFSYDFVCQSPKMLLASHRHHSRFGYPHLFSALDRQGITLGTSGLADGEGVEYSWVIKGKKAISKL
ncbi:hypothetical protein V5O48_014926 [Marasmius crinis-equi]|uniref:Uncharacterized protein n=1 Tax=Marasmius crinis-equi TaxID=585013 RepID=A0ABR3EVX6_9AGAR